jgi:hypothetical protein
MARIYLSPPHLTGRELELLREAIKSNWVAPLGPHVDAFERELAEVARVPHALALSSGTAALHLALLVLGIGPGDEVACSSFTFAASANPIRYVGASPVFVDADNATWTMDPRTARARARRAATRSRRDRRRHLRAMLRLRRRLGCVRSPRVGAHPGRCRVGGRDVPGAGLRRPGRACRLLVATRS